MPSLSWDRAVRCDRHEVEAPDQHPEQEEMTVEADEQKQTDETEEIRHHRDFEPVLNVEQPGEPEPHLHTDKIAGKRHRGERQLHRKSDGNPDKDLLPGKERARPGERNRSGLTDHRGEQARDNGRERHLCPHRNRNRAESWGGGKQRKRAKEWPEELAEPASQIRVTDAQHRRYPKTARTAVIDRSM
jgi:ribosome modulation factor